MKTLVTGILIFLLYTGASPQNSLQVRYNYDSAGNANFIADNYTNIPVYLALDFNYLENASFSYDLPYIKRIEPGTTELFVIYKEPDQPGPRFNIETRWYMSNPEPDTDPGFPYLIPAKGGTTVRISPVRAGENSRSVGFVLLGSGEVHAARKGVVIRVFGQNDPRLPLEGQVKQNFIQILHKDGTVGEYSNFAFNRIICKTGQEVIPGQILGEAARVEGNYFIEFSLFHSDLNSENPKYLIPEFYLGKDRVTQLDESEEYKSVHDNQVIVKELSRKERRDLKNK